MGVQPSMEISTDYQSNQLIEDWWPFTIWIALLCDYATFSSDDEDTVLYSWVCSPSCHCSTAAQSYLTCNINLIQSSTPAPSTPKFSHGPSLAPVGTMPLNATTEQVRVM